MRILVATDAFRPQINGVVRSLEALAASAPALGAEIRFLAPGSFPTVPLPTYAEIRLALAGERAVARRIAAEPVDHVHIATEGPVGLAARRFCLRRGLPFTTSYHTRFPEYVAARLPVPARLTYALLRRFHNAGQGTMVSTPSLARELAERGFTRLMHWSRGVDLAAFDPARRVASDLPKPVFLYAGRLAPEKNLDAFLALDLPGCKVVVGDGPSGATLRRRYPAGAFPGSSPGGRPRRALRVGRRVRVSQPNGHVRHGAAGSAGERPAGCGLSRARPARRARIERGGRPRRGPARGLPGRARHPARGGAGACRDLHLGAGHPPVPSQHRGRQGGARRRGQRRPLSGVR